MEIKTGWIKIFFTYITGIVYALSKIFLPAYFILSLLENIVICVFCRRVSGIGYIFRKTICQGLNLFTTLKYLCIDYFKDNERVVNVFVEDFKELVLKSIFKYPILYINTNNFVYRKVLLPLQIDGMLEIYMISCYRMPQIVEKVQIMDWHSVVRCIWDIKALKKFFRMETICKYRLRRVDTHV